MHIPHTILHFIMFCCFINFVYFTPRRIMQSKIVKNISYTEILDYYLNVINKIINCKSINLFPQARLRRLPPLPQASSTVLLSVFCDSVRASRSPSAALQTSRLSLTRWATLFLPEPSARCLASAMSSSRSSSSEYRSAHAHFRTRSDVSLCPGTRSSKA